MKSFWWDFVNKRGHESKDIQQVNDRSLKKHKQKKHREIQNHWIRTGGQEEREREGGGKEIQGSRIQFESSGEYRYQVIKIRVIVGSIIQMLG